MVKALKNFATNLPKLFSESVPVGPAVIDVDSLPSASLAPVRQQFFDGDKFPGGFGATSLLFADYWTLRERSNELFTKNLYARGLIRRLITNEINVGLNLEATPNGDILGGAMADDDTRTAWSEDVESRFPIWAKNPALCDFKGRQTFGSLQREIRQEALIEGDVLVMLVQSKRTRLPRVRVISGSKVQDPFNAKPRSGNKIVDGVELDPEGRQVAYWIVQDNRISKRVPAMGERSGRRLAWLVYGTDKRESAVRGQPLLSLILQSLKEIDRYRDSAQRKAVINSILAMFIQKDAELMGTKPIGGGAVRKDEAIVTDSDGSSRTFNLSSHIPGVVLDELQKGEKPVGFNSAGTDINFPIFEAAIINAIAWAYEIPPEILTLAFQNNYSASRAAVNEFKLYLDKMRSDFSENVTEPIYQEWLISETLIGKIQAPGFLEAWRDTAQYDIFGAWIASDWTGAIKPSVDLKKEVAAYKDMISEGLITHDKAARELSNSKYSRTIRRLKKENELRAEALRPLLELQAEFNVELIDNPATAMGSEALIEAATENTIEAMEAET